MAKEESSKKKKKKGAPTVNPDLEGLNIEIDSFGEIKTNYDIDKINDFLNKNVADKKLIEREDHEKPKKKVPRKKDNGNNEGE